MELVLDQQCCLQVETPSTIQCVGGSAIKYTLERVSWGSAANGSRLLLRAQLGVAIHNVRILDMVFQKPYT